MGVAKLDAQAVPRVISNHEHLLTWRFSRFFFADERGPDGAPAGSEINGESHAEMYLELVEGKEDLPYYVTFWNGKYEKFD